MAHALPVKLIQAATTASEWSVPKQAGRNRKVGYRLRMPRKKRPYILAAFSRDSPHSPPTARFDSNDC
jgi:hypothetical protein